MLVCSGDEIDNNDYEVTLCDTPGIQHTGSVPLASISKEDEESDSDDSSDEFDAYLFMYTLPPYSSTTIPGKVLLPPGPRHHRTTLVLDLDETLVHCSVNPVEKFDFKFPVAFNAVDYQVYVRKRPYVDYFLEAVAKDFEVVLFTASQSVYADKLLDLLDPDSRIFSGRLFREACLDVNGNFIKDLGVLNRDLSRVLFMCLTCCR
jgi:CTD small phosphatase-like protein 2